LSLTTPVLKGPDGGAATVVTFGGTISVSNAGNLTFQSVTAGQPTTINLNGGPLSISSSGTSSSVTLGSMVTLSSDNNITVTTPMLSLGSAGSTPVINTTGASLPVGTFSWIFVTSPAGSGLTVQLPSGSTALLTTGGPFQSTGFPSKCSGCNSS